METISCIDKVTNVEVLQKVQENRSILNTVQQLKFRWIGHVLRQESLLCDITKGRMLGKATTGRKRLQMLSDVTSKTYKDLKREAGDSSRWQIGRRLKDLTEKYCHNSVTVETTEFLKVNLIIP